MLKILSWEYVEKYNDEKGWIKEKVGIIENRKKLEIFGNLQKKLIEERKLCRRLRWKIKMPMGEG
jgi:hypothetical protein